MPLTFPISKSAKEALVATSFARTQAEAKRSAGVELALASDWLHPSSAEREEWARKIDDGIRDGYVQIYEDKAGKPVVAVTYWKPKDQTAPSSAAKDPAAPAEDYTDDLYFSKAHRKRMVDRRHRQGADPRQMDMFSKLSAKSAPNAEAKRDAVSGNSEETALPTEDSADPTT